MGEMVLREARRVRSFALGGARVNVESSGGSFERLKGVKGRSSGVEAGEGKGLTRRIGS